MKVQLPFIGKTDGLFRLQPFMDGRSKLSCFPIVEAILPNPCEMPHDSL